MCRTLFFPVLLAPGLILVLHDLGRRAAAKHAYARIVAGYRRWRAQFFDHLAHDGDERWRSRYADQPSVACEPHGESLVHESETPQLSNDHLRAQSSNLNELRGEFLIEAYIEN